MKSKDQSATPVVGEHTKGELKYSGHDHVYIFSDKEPVAIIPNYSNVREQQANAERIVKAWNGFDTLYNALMAVYSDIDIANVKGGSDELNAMVSAALQSNK